MRLRWILVGVLGLSLVGCADDGPAERSGIIVKVAPEQAYAYLRDLYDRCGDPVQVTELDPVEVSRPADLIGKKEFFEPVPHVPKRAVARYRVTAAASSQSIELWFDAQAAGSGPLPAEFQRFDWNDPSSVLRADPSCTCTMPEVHVPMDDEDACLIEFLVARCGPGDQCLIDCATSGDGCDHARCMRPGALARWEEAARACGFEVLREPTPKAVSDPPLRTEP